MKRLQLILNKVLNLDDSISYQIFLTNIFLFSIIYVWFFFNSDRPAFSYWLDAPLMVFFMFLAIKVWSDKENPSELRWMMKITIIATFLFLLTGVIFVLRELVK